MKSSTAEASDCATHMQTQHAVGQCMPISLHTLFVKIQILKDAVTVAALVVTVQEMFPGPRQGPAHGGTYGWWAAGL